MKKNILYSSIILITAALALTVLLNTQTEDKSTEETRPVVAATLFPLYDITTQIAGEEVTVELILPPGTSPHTFDPTPKQLKAIQDADIIFTVGHGLDSWVEKIIPADARIVQLDTNIDLKEFPQLHEDEHHDEHADEEEEEEEDDDHAHTGIDPHYWLNPENGLLMAETISKELALLVPEEAQTIEINTIEFKQHLEQAISKWKETIIPIEQKPFATLHGAFYYLADFANATLAVTFEPSPGKEPTPQYLATLTHEIEELHIKALFSEPQLSFSGIQAFAMDTGINTGILDPIGGTDERLSYISLIEYNINTLVEALR
jgi:zinc transport system substrate-binding protein